MTRKTSSPHVIASQALYAARLATQGTPDNYKSEVFSQLKRIEYGLADWELTQIREEIAFRLAAVHT
jgi:hypothetical protein